MEAEMMDDVKIENRTPGKIIFIREGKPVIVCGTGLVKLMKVIDDQTGEELLPFNNFRIKLSSKKVQ